MIINLTKNIKIVRPEAKAVFPYSNSIYIDGDVKTVIDAGAGGRAYSDIQVEEVNLVLLSHNHFDHVNGVGFFKNAKIMAGKEEEGTYSDAHTYRKYLGITEWQKLMGDVNREKLVRNIALPDDIPVKYGFNSIKLNGVFADGDKFDLGQIRVTAVHTPGHSKGHYAFFFEKEGILFSGDIDLAPCGPWYGASSSDVGELIESVKKLMAIRPKILVTSHRRVFDSKDHDIQKLFQQYLDIILKKEEKMLGYLSEPRTIDEISRQEFARSSAEKAPYASFWNKMMVAKHLQRLKRMGLIRELENNYYVKAEDKL